jgi:isopropylmalate/homocitrate/citramalate synthase
LNKIQFVDGTLREGEQTPGVFFTRQEKIEIAKALDAAGVAIIDAGMPSISEDEQQTIAAISRQGLSAAIGVTVLMKRSEIDLAKACGANEIFLICPVSNSHLERKLDINEEKLKITLSDIIHYGTQNGLGVNLVAEDASRAELPFLCHLLGFSHECGARRVFLCDTLGVMAPSRMRALVETVKCVIPKSMGIGVHCHDDLGLATANTLAGVKAGAAFPAVTVNGIGERAGNAPLQEVAMGIETLFHQACGIDLSRIFDLAKLVETCSGILIPPHAPIVGFNAFRHESGIHVDGLLKSEDTYTGVNPVDLHRKTSFVIGKHSGTHAIRGLLQGNGHRATDEQIAEILKRIKATKVSESKSDIRHMVEEIRHFHEKSLNFSAKAFWKIVEEVL